MKVVILAGGLGTRLSEETILKPKPMVEVGGKPILWHIMKIYSHYDFNEFIICIGYKGEIIKEYFSNYLLLNNDLHIDISEGRTDLLSRTKEKWKIWLIDTGMRTNTGGRLKRVGDFIKDDIFMMTYGDGLSDVNIDELLRFHKSHDRLVTFTAVQPEGRFGSVHFDSEGVVQSFVEKPTGDGGWINGGFYVINKRALELVEGEDTVWERGPLQSLASTKNLMAYRHKGFWKAMDTLNDKVSLENIWNSGNAPWKVWKE